jgi:hypothetical protein
LGAGSGPTLCNKTEQRGFGDEARKRIRHSNAQCKNNQPILGIISGLNRVIPGVERLNERTNEAGEQSKRSSYSERPRSHGFEYSAVGYQGGKQSLRTVPSKIGGSDGTRTRDLLRDRQAF